MLGVRTHRFQRIVRLRTNTILDAAGCTKDRWFWYRWFCIALTALDQVANA